MPVQEPSPEERRAAYEAYLASPEWRAIRQRVLARDGHACVFCNSDERLDVHHRTYERFGSEELSDLTTLCRRCHERHHGGSFDKPKSTRKTTPKPGLSKKKRAKANAAGVVGPSAEKILAWMQTHPRQWYTRGEIQAALHLSKGDVTRGCSALVARGDLGRKSTRTWFLMPARDLLAESASAKARADERKDAAIVIALSEGLAKRRGGKVGPELRVVQKNGTAVTPRPLRPITLDEINAAQTPAGGWTKEQLASWGVPWPPPSGWKRRLIESARDARRTQTL